jgi:hypothetical protein
MKRALIAAALIAAAGGVDAQSNREQHRLWIEHGDSTFWTRLERWVPDDSNPKRCVLQNLPTGLTWEGQIYLMGTAPEPPVLPPMRTETLSAGGAVFVVSGRDLTIDTIAMPEPPPDTVIPPDTVPLPPPDTIAPPDTLPPVGRLELNVGPQTWGYDLEVFAYDPSGAPVANEPIEFTASGGFFGPASAPLCTAPCTLTRTTTTTGRAVVGWRITVGATDDSVVVDGIGFSYVVKNEPPPTEPPPALSVDSVAIIPESSPTRPIAVDTITNRVQLFAVLYEGDLPYVCAVLAQGRGWYEALVTAARDSVFQLPAGRFVPDVTCSPQPLVAR